eukprot:2231462-Pleurochrysis_carterae.AAC.7
MLIAAAALECIVRSTARSPSLSLLAHARLSKPCARLCLASRQLAILPLPSIAPPLLLLRLRFLGRLHPRSPSPRRVHHSSSLRHLMLCACCDGHGGWARHAR